MSSNAVFKIESPSAVADTIAISGLSHKTGSVDLREQFSLKAEQYAPALAEVLACEGVDEAVVVSTCNRVEIVAAVDSSGATKSFPNQIEQVFSKLSGLERERFRTNLYHLRGGPAVGHVFRVAAGLDSLVPGEPQILGQLKSAFQQAQENGSAKFLLNRLFQRAFGVAKAVRSRTEIGRRAVSVCFAARELAEKIYSDLDRKRVMLIGAGEMGALTLKHFQAAGVQQFFLANKTLARAASLAEEVGGVALGLDVLNEFLPQADIVIGAAALERGAPPLLDRAAVTRSLERRPGEPQLFIDLAVPRNFAAEIDDLSDAFLFNIDNLEGVVRENLDARRGELNRAELIVDEEVEKFLSWLERRAVEPVIKSALAHCQSLKEHEVERTMRRIRQLGLSSEQQQQIECALSQLGEGLLAKLMHKPLQTLKTQSDSDTQLVPLFEELFGLNRKV